MIFRIVFASVFLFSSKCVFAEMAYAEAKALQLELFRNVLLAHTFISPAAFSSLEEVLDFMNEHAQDKPLKKLAPAAVKRHREIKVRAELAMELLLKNLGMVLTSPLMHLSRAGFYEQHEAYVNATSFHASNMMRVAEIYLGQKFTREGDFAFLRSMNANSYFVFHNKGAIVEPLSTMNIDFYVHSSRFCPFHEQRNFLFSKGRPVTQEGIFVTYDEEASQIYPKLFLGEAGDFKTIHDPRLAGLNTHFASELEFRTYYQRMNELINGEGSASFIEGKITTKKVGTMEPSSSRNAMYFLPLPKAMDVEELAFVKEGVRFVEELAQQAVSGVSSESVDMAQDEHKLAHASFIKELSIFGSDFVPMNPHELFSDLTALSDSIEEEINNRRAEEVAEASLPVKVHSRKPNRGAKKRKQAPKKMARVVEPSKATKEQNPALASFEESLLSGKAKFNEFMKHFNRLKHSIDFSDVTVVTNGSHIVLHKPGKPKITIVRLHGGKDRMRAWQIKLMVEALREWFY